MGRAIDTGLKCIELNAAIDRLISATDDDALRSAEKDLDIVKHELFAMVKNASPACVNLIKDTFLRGSYKMEAAAKAVTRVQ